MPSTRCPACGARNGARNRFCSDCGARLPGTDGTAVLDVPPHETSASPVHVVPAEPHFYGVTPPIAVLILGVAAAAVSVLLLAQGSVLLGLIVLAAAIALGAGFLALARLQAVDRARDRASSLIERAAVRSDTRRRLLRLRYELELDASARERALLALGAAVYGSDDAGIETLRAEISGLDQATAAKEAEMSTITAGAEALIQRSQLQSGTTELLEPPAPSPGGPDPGGPVIVPEPYPPPDEGDPATPAPVPEPYPPDEVTPPQMER